MSDIRILHLSDVHFGCSDFDHEQPGIATKLIAAARRHVAGDRARNPDLLIFSGDLAYSAKPEQFARGADWLKRISDELGCPLFIVPGNHDVLRPAPGSPESLAAFMHRATAASGEEGYEKIRSVLREARSLDNFCEWHAKFARDANVCSNWSNSRLACSAEVSVRGRRVRLLGLNTALASLDDKDQSHLVADVAELNKFLLRDPAGGQLDIVVTHHPVEFGERKRTRWMAEWNNRKLADFLSQQTGAHIYLHGHTHESRGGTRSSVDGQRLFSYGAGACYETQRPKVFAFFEVDFAGQSIKPSAFEHNPKSGEWDPYAKHSYAVPAALPSGGARPSATQVNAADETQKTLSSEDALKRLDALSNSCAESLMPSDAIDDPILRKRLIELFDELVESALSSPIDNIADEILDNLATGKSRLWTVIGEMGAGKAEFMALLYWMARRRRLKLGHEFPPTVFIDPRRWDLEAGDQAAALIDAAVGLGGRPVVFVCGIDPAKGEKRLNGFRLADRLTEAGAVKVVARHERAFDKAHECVVRIKTPPHERALVGRYVSAMEPIIKEPVTPDWRDKLEILVQKICVDHRVPVSMYLIRECGIAVARQPEVKTFSDALRVRLTEIAEGEPRWSVDEMARRAFSVFKERPQYAGNRGELMMQLERDCPPDLRRFLSTHPSVEHWLVALHAFNAFEIIGCHLAPPSPSSPPVPGRNVVVDLYLDLKFVYPAHINTFAKELFAQSLRTHRTQIIAALKDMLCSRDTPAGRLLKAHACYLAGRLPLGMRPPEFTQALRDNAAHAEARLREIRVLRAAGRWAKAMQAEEVEARLPALVKDLFKTPLNGDWDFELHKIARELLLLQRSALISLAYVEDREAAKQYIDGLLTDVDKDDMNRGFHLEYYGDVEFKPMEPLLSTDLQLHDCPQSFAALMECLAKHTTSTALAAIQAVTLASLARHRHANFKLEAGLRGQIVESLNAARRTFSDDATLTGFLTTVIAELGQEEFVIERYVDGLYELKFQRRVGWEDLQPPESVAAHIYFVELLGRLFVPERGVDRIRVMRLVSHHDLAEAILGDTRIDVRGAEERQRENDVIRRIAQLGALTGSAQLNELTSDYERFDRRGNTVEDRIARDLDRLDLLIQLMRYRRENVDIPRYEKFRKFVEPSQFNEPSMQAWAKRFLRYFDVQIGKNLPALECTEGLWPHPVVSHRIFRKD